MLEAGQQSLFGFELDESQALVAPVFSDYDYILVPTSGGKDSLASLLYLIEEGVPLEKIELLHHKIDGSEGSELMDWPCTEAYVRALAAALKVPVHFSWRRGGFEAEMTRSNAQAQPVTYELPDGNFVTRGGDRSTFGTRLMFPQMSAALATRWCSSALKISVCDMLITGQDRFLNKKTLVVTGERAEESSARAKYKPFEPHRTDNRNGSRIKRHVDHYRPVHAWSAQKVWEIIRRNRIQFHPSYAVGWGRCSCLLCVFGSKNQWATIRKYMPEKFLPIANYEKSFGVTIHRKLSVTQQADLGVPYEVDPFWLSVAMSKEFKLPIFVDDWQLPPGAFGEANGPT